MYLNYTKITIKNKHCVQHQTQVKKMRLIVYQTVDRNEVKHEEIMSIIVQTQA